MLATFREILGSARALRQGLRLEYIQNSQGRQLERAHLAHMHMSHRLLSFLYDDDKTLGCTAHCDFIFRDLNSLPVCSIGADIGMISQCFPRCGSCSNHGSVWIEFHKFAQLFAQAVFASEGSIYSEQAGMWGVDSSKFAPTNFPCALAMPWDKCVQHTSRRV